MKKKLLLLPLLLLLAAGCKKETDIIEPASDEFLVKTLGINPDCGIPAVQVLDRPAEMAQLVGATGSAAYVVVHLDSALGRQPDRLLLVRVRKAAASEGVICKAYGPGYPLLAIVSARLR